ncbi:MAG: AsnC family transcriptional regulator [Candidatus Micrarchaeota archaeon]|nr:AsnC family transcriptional regulator [Candidatus Micrarchaeota archaeon]MDE1848206.1 AsnC family transcriptional regulator [Candidatus Micrarchaeota archaeon]MDE1864854.1 AsnC family transcriptional regulator [Candidatus Micrarchaeota archaeon]
MEPPKRTVELPKLVAEELKRLRREFPFYIVLQSKNGNHYLYKHSTKWDPQNKKVRTSRTYLGKITDDGKFLRKVLRGIEQKEMTVLPDDKMPLDEIDKTLLTVLSMNARADLAHYGRQLGMKPEEAYRRVKNLEKRFGITYITEIDVEKLGYLIALPKNNLTV